MNREKDCLKEKETLLRDLYTISSFRTELDVYLFMEQKKAEKVYIALSRAMELMLHRLEEMERLENKDTGLTPKQICEIGRLYAEQAEELARYKEIGFDIGLSPDMVKAAHQLANVNIEEDDE